MKAVGFACRGDARWRARRGSKPARLPPGSRRLRLQSDRTRLRGSRVRLRPYICCLWNRRQWREAAVHLQASSALRAHDVEELKRLAIEHRNVSIPEVHSVQETLLCIRREHNSGYQESVGP